MTLDLIVTLSIGGGFVWGAGGVFWLMNREVDAFCGEAAAAEANAADHRRRATDMHRRAQAAEGRLARIGHILDEEFQK